MQPVFEDKIQFCASILERMKQEACKRDEIYKHGVDLINYENGYLHCLYDVLEYLLPGMREHISWWLWADVEKKYWVDKKEIKVEKAIDFLMFHLKPDA